MSVRTLQGPYKYQWSQFELVFMKANFMNLTNRKLADMLGHRPTLVRTKCYEMGLKRMEMEYWTDEQIKFLIDNYKQLGDSELAEIYDVKWRKDKGWSKKHIEKKRRYLKLIRTDQEKKSIKDRNKEMGRWMNTTTWETRGETPVGERRVWRYRNGRSFMVIKLKTGFVHYAPWLYEQLYGPIPKGMVVRTKDNNPLNVKPGNIELIDRAEHAGRNASTSSGLLTDNYVLGILCQGNRHLRPYVTPDLIELKRLQLTLNRTINGQDTRKETAEHA